MPFLVPIVIGMSIYSASAQATAAKKQAGAQEGMFNALNKDYQTPAQQQETATEKAQKALTARRRSILAGGGQTDITGGTAVLQSSSNRMKSLLGE